MLVETPETGTPPSSEDTVPGAASTPGVKLTIKRFNGDSTRWVTFWDSFESAIHKNPSLTDVDKFNYLKSFLESSAAEAIAGFTLTSANYAEAVATLFGNTQLIVNKHMEDLACPLSSLTTMCKTCVVCLMP